MNCWSFDTSHIVLPEHLVAIRNGKAKDFSWDSVRTDAKGSVSLSVSIIASHSGALINNRVYPGVDMRASAHTWTKPYPKLITNRHPNFPSFFGGGDTEEPIPLGRVDVAKYIRTEPDLEKFKLDWKRPDEVGAGSGYMDLKATITDEAAIDKIVDKRYMTVSQGCKLLRAVCSICGSDWVKAGTSCDHMPGKVYETDEKRKSYSKCFLIAGPMDYDHCAIVNRPADAYAMIVGHDSFDNSVFKLVPEDQLPLATVSSIAIIDKLGPTLLYSEEEARLMIDSAKTQLQSVIVSLPTYGPHPVADNPEEDVMTKNKDEKPESNEGAEPVSKDGTESEGTLGKSENPEAKEPEKPEAPVEKPKEGDKEGEEETKDPEEGAEETEEPKDSYSEEFLIQIGALRSNDKISVDWTSLNLDEKELQTIEALDAKATAEIRKGISQDQYVGPFVAATQEQIKEAKKLLVHVKAEDKAKILLKLDEKERELKNASVTGKEKDAALDNSTAIKLENYKASLQAKVKEQERLLEQLVSKDTESRVFKAKGIVLMKQLLGRDDVKFDSQENCAEYIQKLAARDTAYLDGTYEDLEKELGSVKGLTVLSPGTVLDPTKPAGDSKASDKKEDTKTKKVKPKAGTAEWCNKEFDNLMGS